MTEQPSVELNVQRISGVWCLYEGAVDDPHFLAIFTDGKTAARFCNIARLMDSKAPGDKVRINIRLPEELLSLVQGMLGHAAD